MASTSCAKQCPAPAKQPVMNYVQYPAPQARYEDVASDPKLFMSTLESLHAAMGTKFMIPIIGGRELDLHRLFVEVTSRGGLEKIIRERRWKEVTAIFNFPSTATNASFVLRKYYGSLLHHYEQLYFFKARGWTPGSSVPMQSPLASRLPAQVTVQPSPEYQAATAQQQRTNTAELYGARIASSGSSQVIGVIDGKFESGYLVTVTIGTEKLKGVLYQAPQNHPGQEPQSYSIPANNTGDARAASGMQRRRRRRKKNEIKRRDPAHPKPNRSGYNFFFAEQHARLKPLYPGKDREISRMIGELWSNVNETEKAVYQEKAVKDKERYRIEMEDYRERLRTGRVISDAVPLQQWLPEHDSDMVDADIKTDEIEGEDSLQTPENESSSGKSDSADEDDTAKESLDRAASLNIHAGHMDIDSPAEAPASSLANKEENIGDQGADKVGNIGEQHKDDAIFDTDKERVPGEGQ
ncbi:high mobility group B protein 15 [Ricinus communis]|uniref:high mobility group B protein 15 n=1 Tax=Ricinus communis TaxID=3988 RepID=UPI00201AF382|nr:high mobility group B protein 15 [Ricinus communis]XP_048235483.1 high mobility group B protein 15 [Ricinus communis]